MIGFMILLSTVLGFAIFEAFDDDEATNENNSNSVDDADDSSPATDSSNPGETISLSALLGDDNANEIAVDQEITDSFRVTAEGGNDTIQTGAGDDRIFAGSGDDNVNSDAGDDRVFLGEGDDFWSDVAGRNDPNFGGDDFVRGGSGADQLVGLGGSDTFYGDTGNDTLDAREVITEFNGNGAYADQVFGGFGNDFIVADDGDIVVGGEGSDTISVNFAPSFGESQTASEDWSPVEVTDFNPEEDTLEVWLPFGSTETGETLGYVGRDGEEITLTYGELQLVTLKNVFFADLTEDNLEIR